MNYRIIKTILCKELLETLRDKRTLFAMIGLPIILYPAVFLIMTQVTIVQQSKLDAQRSRISLVGPDAGLVSNWLTQANSTSNVQTQNDHIEELLANIYIKTLDEKQTQSINEAIESSNENKLSLEEYALDAIITVYPVLSPVQDGKTDANANFEIRICYDNTIPASGQAKNRIQKLLERYRQEQQQQRLTELGLDFEAITPVSLEVVDIAPPEKTIGSMLGRILPMLMIISLAVAAFYPALDLTAGEKERGTFETLLSTPVGKTDIVTGKFLAIFILAMITASLSLGSMALTLIGQLSQFSNSVSGPGSPFASLSISPYSIAIMLLVLIPLAFFICSVMMSIALFARNIQEAQHYVTPFYLCIVLPAVIAAIPTVEITKFTMLLPIINVALLFKELLIGNFDPETITAVFVSISGWALLALTVSVRLFQNEQLILSQEKGLPLTLKRSRLLPAEKPGVGLALGLFAFCLLALFYIGSWFQSKSLISGIIITEWFIVLLPVMLTLWFYKINIPKTLSLKAPRWYEPILSMIFILATLVVVMRLGIEQAKYMPMPNMDNNTLLNSMISDNPSWLQTLQMLFAIAFSAAVCEEVLFRGVVLSGLSKPEKNTLMAVIITAGLFAIMHLSIYRLMPTFILGLALGYLTCRTGSIFNSMLAHCFNNAIPVLIFHKRLPQQITSWMEQFEGPDPSVIKPMPVWLIISALAVIVGIIFILEQQKQSHRVILENTTNEN